MKPLYVTAVVTFSGKTALALGIGLKLQSMGKRVGYLKPISTQPFYLDGKLVDEDADFVRRALGLEAPATALSPVIVDDRLLDELMRNATSRDFAAEVRAAFNSAGEGKDALLVEGGASMREGYLVGLNPQALADLLDLPTLGVVRYRSNVLLVDDVLALQQRMGSRLLGVVINSVPEDGLEAVRSKFIPYLEGKGVRRK
jgi:hypothetical protein